MANLPKTMSAKAAAEYFGIDYKLLRSWIKREDPNRRPPGFFPGGSSKSESGRMGHFVIITEYFLPWLEQEGRRQV